VVQLEALVQQLLAQAKTSSEFQAEGVLDISEDNSTWSQRHFTYSAEKDTLTQYAGESSKSAVEKTWVVQSFSNVAKQGAWSRGRKHRFNIISKEPSKLLRLHAPTGAQAKQNWMAALEEDKDIKLGEEVGDEAGEGEGEDEDEGEDEGEGEGQGEDEGEDEGEGEGEGE
jgi:hypothetical protein